MFLHTGLAGSLSEVGQPALCYFAKVLVWNSECITKAEANYRAKP